MHPTQNGLCLEFAPFSAEPMTGKGRKNLVKALYHLFLNNREWKMQILTFEGAIRGVLFYHACSISMVHLNALGRQIYYSQPPPGGNGVDSGRLQLSLDLSRFSLAEDDPAKFASKYGSSIELVAQCFDFSKVSTFL
jgi:hypothetical protein